MRYIKHTFIVYTLFINLANANEINEIDCKNIITSAQVHVCSEKDLVKSNKKLLITLESINNRIDKLYSADKKLKRKLTKALNKSQTSWEKHRMDHCRFEAFEIDRNSPSYTTATNHCHIRINDQRIAVLDALYKPI